MKNLITLLFFYLFSTLFLLAQSNIEGSVSDENGVAISTVIVKLYSNNDQTIVKEMTPDATGYFIIENIVDGNYWLEVSSINYETIKIEDFRFPQDSDKVMGLVLDDLDINQTITAGRIEAMGIRYQVSGTRLDTN